VCDANVITSGEATALPGTLVGVSGGPCEGLSP
jgi:hypothetical protein